MEIESPSSVGSRKISATFSFAQPRCKAFSQTLSWPPNGVHADVLSSTTASGLISNQRFN